MVELRAFDVGFARHLVELWAATFEQAYKGVHSEQNIRAYCRSNFTLEAAEAALSDSNVICKVAIRNRSSALGFYVLKHHRCPVPLDGGSSELKQIYVVAGEYGSGVGRVLFDDAIRCIQDAGGEWIWLSVSDRNRRAQSFYRKLAFKPLGAGPVFEVGSDRLTSTIMARQV